MTNPLQNVAQVSQKLREAAVDVTRELAQEQGRRRGVLNKALYEIETHFDRSVPYFSQAGQDRIVDRVLGQKTGGVFVDVGGYNGVKGSNSLFFEMFRGWNGILIEPSPTQLRTAKTCRRCPCIGAAVAGTKGASEFLEITQGYTQMSGFIDSYEPATLDQVRAHPRHAETTHTLEHVLLGDLLKTHKLYQIDFVSVDVEGGEMGILQNFDFDAFDVDIWTIENNNQSSDLPQFMRKKGYDLIEFAGVDDIFRKRR